MNPLAATDDSSTSRVSKSKRPFVVFIPGTFHTAAHFGPLSQYLESQGCENFAIRLPSIGEKAGTAGTAEDVATIRAVLTELVCGKGGKDGKEGRGYDLWDSKNKEVILVMHSSGAVPGCQAITNLERSLRIKEGKKGGVVGVVFINGLLVDEGESLESTIRETGAEALPSYAEVMGPIIRPINATSFLYSDLPPDQAAHWERHLEPQSASVYTTPVQNTCWDLDLPITYVRCIKDPLTSVTDAMVAKTKRANWSIKTIEAGHCPFVGFVGELGDIILRAGTAG